MELRKLDVSEVKSRQAELAKMRSLLFHAEIKVLRLLALLVQRCKYWREDARGALFHARIKAKRCCSAGATLRKEALVRLAW